MIKLLPKTNARASLNCPFSSQGCKFKMYPTHDEHLWVSKNYIGRHLADKHRDEMEGVLLKLMVDAWVEEVNKPHGFRRGL